MNPISLTDAVSTLNSVAEKSPALFQHIAGIISDVEHLCLTQNDIDTSRVKNEMFDTIAKFMVEISEEYPS